jgi:hypothetical protein
MQTNPGISVSLLRNALMKLAKNQRSPSMAFTGIDPYRMRRPDLAPRGDGGTGGGPKSGGGGGGRRRRQGRMSNLGGAPMGQGMS